MKIFNLKEQVLKLNSPVLFNQLVGLEKARIEEVDIPKKIKLNRLHELNKRRSVTSSNEIEGITVSKTRETGILDNTLTPETKEEYLLFGYNKALERIYQVYRYQNLDEKFILDLHYLLYESFNPSYGGRYKMEQNYINQYDEKGNFVRHVFTPLKPSETAQAMGNLIYQYQLCATDPDINPIVLIFVFTVDFLCIHPFGDGNGRISRLLTTFLLLKNGYNIDSYYSTSYMILSILPRYYESLERSSAGWYEDRNNYSRFVIYMIETIRKCYEKLAYIIDINKAKSFSVEKILKVINDSPYPITKAEIEELLINYSRTTIELELGILLKENKIQAVQKGKYTKYFRI